MNSKREKEECLETLWYMKERGQTDAHDLQEALGSDFDSEIVKQLGNEQLIDFDENKHTIQLTSKGLEYARKLVRAHRLAERLIHDVLGEEYETGACEFEHTVNGELIDGICTLLGHPRECPHGMAIPEGECCRQSITSAQSTVVPLTQLDVGQSARISYVQCKNDQQLHKLEDLQIRPGTTIKLHQVYPSFVIECEGASIALDRDVAANIRVWRPEGSAPAQAPQARRRGWGRFGFRRRRRGPG